MCRTELSSYVALCMYNAVDDGTVIFFYIIHTETYFLDVHAEVVSCSSNHRLFLPLFIHCEN